MIGVEKKSISEKLKKKQSTFFSAGENTPVCVIETLLLDQIRL